MKEGCIAVFAKTPGLSPLKTRLAKDIGREVAEDIFISCVNILQNTLEKFKSKNQDWDIFWALAEEEGINNPFWKNRPFKKIWTDEGELGTRLHHINSTLKKEYQNVILIGTDCPHITVSIFNQTLDYLQQNKMIIGPATDGGYYLFASSSSIEKEIWENVPYSSKETMNVFIKLLNSDVKKLTPLTDLDNKSEIPDLLEEINNLNNESNQQLIKKLKSILN